MSTSNSTPVPAPDPHIRRLFRPRLLAPTAMVTLLSRKSKESKFIVHKAFACHYSPVLNAAFNSEFLEGKTQTYCLREVPSAVVQLFVEWLYSQELEAIPAEGSSYPMGKHYSLKLCVLWILADNLLIPRLKNQAIGCLARRRDITKKVATNCLKYVWKETQDGSPLRRLFLHHCAHFLDSKYIMRHPHSFPHEMLIELAAILIEESRGNTTRSKWKNIKISEFEVPEI